MIRPIFLRMRLTDMLKVNPYAKYMKDIITNKRKIPEAEISTMLANYTFKGGYPWISKFLWYSTLKSIISKHGGNFSFRYLSFISNDIPHIFSIRICFETSVNRIRKKIGLIISAKRSKSSSSFFLDGLGGKGMGF